MQKINLPFLKCLFFLFTCFSELIALSQPKLVLDTIYLPGKTIHKVRSSYNGEIWFVDSSSVQNIYRITRNGNLENRSSEFTIPLQSGIVDLVCPDTNEVVVGTCDQFSFHYKNGSLKTIDAQSVIAVGDTVVNSLFLRRDIVKQFGSVLQENTTFGIGTTGNAYVSHSVEQPLTRIAGNFLEMPDKKFLSKDDYFLFSYHTSEGTLVRYYNPSMTMDYPLYSLEEYGEALCGNVMHYDNGGIFGSFIGFEKGFITRSQSGYFRFLTSQAIHAIVELKPYGTLIAADSGLYYSGSVTDLTKIDLNIGEFSAYDLENYDGNIYVATNKGLLKIFNSDCNIYHTSLDQDKQCVDPERNENVRFNASLSNGTNEVLWDLGDSTISDKPFISHAYSNNRNYRIRLVSSNGYCTDSSSNILVSVNGTAGPSPAFNDTQLIAANDYSASDETIIVADLDGDIKPDIFLPPKGMYKLIYADTMRFIPVEIFESWIHKAVAGDLNNDGLNEIISGTDIFINNGYFSFTKKSISSETVFYSTSVPCLFDYNNDGKLDIATGDENRFAVFINKGNFNFEKINDKFDSESAASGINWFDIDNDDDPDLLLTRGYYQSNSLYINDNGNFNKIDHGILTTLHGEAIITGDLNNDRKADLYTADHQENYLLMGGQDSLKLFKNTWLTNETNPLIHNIYNLMGRSSLADFDNNGYLDCINDNSRIFMNYGNMLFKNKLDSQFISKSLFGLNNLEAVDISNDGKVDLILDNAGISFSTNIRRDLILLNTTTTQNHWIKINCLGTKSNFNAIGAKIYVKSKIKGTDTWQYRYIESSQNNHNQTGYELHFGLAESPVTDTVEVLWPSGKRSIYSGLSGDKTYNLIEPFIRYEGDTVICENESALFKMPEADGITYEWTLNDSPVHSGDTWFRARKPGEYKCIIHYATFRDTTASIMIHLKKVSAAFIRFENDSVLCPGDSIQIHSAEYQGASYKWMINGDYDSTLQNPSIYISGALYVQQILKNDLNCYDTSNFLHLRYDPAPDIFFSGHSDICDGDTAIITVSRGYSKYLWSNGDTTFSTRVTSNEPLYVQIWNEYNCSTTDTFDHHVWPVPISNLGADLTIAYSGHTYLNVCTDSSQNNIYNWNDGPVGCNRLIEGTELNIGKHELSLVVVSDHDCISSDTIIVEIVLSTNDEALNKKDLLVFPNPSYGEFKIYINNSLVSSNTIVSILDLSGNLIETRTYNLESPRIVDFKFERKGTGQFILRVTGNNHYAEEKILIL